MTEKAELTVVKNIVSNLKVGYWRILNSMNDLNSYARRVLVATMMGKGIVDNFGAGIVEYDNPGIIIVTNNVVDYL